MRILWQLTLHELGNVYVPEVFRICQSLFYPMNFVQAFKIIISNANPVFRMVHGFTSSGLLETQYRTTCQAANIGYLDEQYVSSGDVFEFSVTL